MDVKRSRSPDLAIKNTRQLKRSTITYRYAFCCFGLPSASPGKEPICKPLSWFLAAVSRLRPCSQSVWPIRFTHKPYSFRTPHYLPTTGGNQKSMLITKRSLYFFAALWWGRHLLAFTVAEHRTDAMFCWPMTHPYTTMPRKTSDA